MVERRKTIARRKNGRQKTEGNPRAAGAPTKPLDWITIGRMAETMCGEEDIAHIVGCSVATLQRRCVKEQGQHFGEFINNLNAQGRTSLRRAQFELAVGREGKLLKDEDGHLVLDDKNRPRWEILPIAPNPTSAIWLGKQWLGQTDKQELSGKDGTPITPKQSFFFVMPDGSTKTAQELKDANSNTGKQDIAPSGAVSHTV